MPVPWEISAALATASLSALGVVATLTLVEVRRTLRNAGELSAAAERHFPAILRNLDEISRHADSMASSFQALSRKAANTGDEFEEIGRSVRLAARSLETDVIEPGLKIMKVLSTLFAFGAAIRRIRHPLGIFRFRGQAGL